MIAQFRKKYPHIRIKHFYKVFDQKPNIGLVRKYLTDSILMMKQNAGIKRPIIIISNDADLRDVKPSYVNIILRAFQINPMLDIVWGRIDYLEEVYKKAPLLYAAQRLWDIFEIILRSHYPDIIKSCGANTAFRSSIYAAIGGYNPHTQLGEDLEIGWAIREARGSRNIVRHIKYLISARVKTSSRRAVLKMLGGVPLIRQWEDWHINEDVRRKINEQIINLDEVIQGKLEFDEQRFRQEVQALYDFYRGKCKSRGGWLDDEIFKLAWKRTMKFAGIKFTINEQNGREEIQFQDISELKGKIDKFRRALISQRGI